MTKKRMSLVAIILAGLKERSVYFQINLSMSSRYQSFHSCRASALHRRTREYRVAGSECNEYHRTADSPGAGAPRSPRPTLCAPEPPPVPEGEPTETADSFDEDESSFGCGVDWQPNRASVGRRTRVPSLRASADVPPSFSLSLCLSFSRRPPSGAHPARTRGITGTRVPNVEDVSSRSVVSCRLTSRSSRRDREPGVRRPSRNEEASVLRWILTGEREPRSCDKDVTPPRYERIVERTDDGLTRQLVGWIVYEVGFEEVNVQCARDVWSSSSGYSKISRRTRPMDVVDRTICAERKCFREAPLNYSELRWRECIEIVH